MAQLVHLGSPFMVGLVLGLAGILPLWKIGRSALNLLSGRLDVSCKRLGKTGGFGSSSPYL